jgi:hypothetical protein
MHNRNNLINRATIVLLFVFAIPLLAQQRVAPMPEPPKLPMIKEHACPFEGCSFREWTVLKDFDVFDTWKSPRKKLDTIRHGDKVLGETGVFVTWEADRVRATRDIPALKLKSGDMYLRYMYEGEGFWDLWAAGFWVHRRRRCLCERNRPSRMQELQCRGPLRGLQGMVGQSEEREAGGLDFGGGSVWPHGRHR